MCHGLKWTTLRVFTWILQTFEIIFRGWTHMLHEMLYIAVQLTRIVSKFQAKKRKIRFSTPLLVGCVHDIMEFTAFQQKNIRQSERY